MGQWATVLNRIISYAEKQLGSRNSLVLGTLQRRCEPLGVFLESLPEYLELRRGNHAIRIAHKHFVYVPEIAAQFDAYFAQVRSTPRAGIETVDYSKPARHVLPSGLSFDMPAFPEEQESIDAYFKYWTPRPGDLVYDIGAHCGMSTYRLSTLVGPTGRVIAFEPDPATFPFLIRNIEYHKLSNVVPIQAAVLDRGGKLPFSSEGALGSGFPEYTSRGTADKTVMVEGVTLTEAFQKYGVPSFCKLDIEGAETAALEAASEAIKKERIHFALDTNHPNGQLATTHEAVEEVFRRCGYQVKSEAINGLMNTWASPSH